MKYGIRLISKFTGSNVMVLGTQYDSQQEAREFFEKNCCPRFNRMELVYINDGDKYINGYIGFAPR